MVFSIKGNIILRWFAKKVDYSTPMYNDSVLYRQEYSYQMNISNIYDIYHYKHRDRDGNYRAKIPLEEITHPSRLALLHYIVTFNDDE